MNDNDNDNDNALMMGTPAQRQPRKSLFLFPCISCTQLNQFHLDCSMQKAKRAKFRLGKRSGNEGKLLQTFDQPWLLQMFYREIPITVLYCFFLFLSKGMLFLVLLLVCSLGVPLVTRLPGPGRAMGLFRRRSLMQCGFFATTTVIGSLGGNESDPQVMAVQDIMEIVQSPDVTPAAVGLLDANNGTVVFAVVGGSDGSLSFSLAKDCNYFLLQPQLFLQLPVAFLRVYASTNATVSFLTNVSLVTVGWVEGVNGRQPGIVNTANIKSPTSDIVGLGLSHKSNLLLLSSTRIDIVSDAYSGPAGIFVANNFDFIASTSITSFDLGYRPWGANSSWGGNLIAFNARVCFGCVLGLIVFLLTKNSRVQVAIVLPMLVCFLRIPTFFQRQHSMILVCGLQMPW
jgi:hypothetical protein